MSDIEDAEKTIAGIFEEMLDTPVGPQDDFFDLGGYSLLVVEVVDRAKQAGIALTALDVFDHPTAAALARLAAGAADAPEAAPDPQPEMVAHVWRTSMSPWDAKAPSTLVPLIPEGTGEPLFCVHLGHGHVRLFEGTAKLVHHGRPVYGIEAIGYRERVRPFLSVAETAEHYLGQIRGVQPHGPYHLSGLCAGGIVAIEIARRLRAAGERIGSLTVVDLPFGMPEFDPGWGVTEHYEYLVGTLRNRFGLEDRVADLPKVLAELQRRVWFEPEDTIEDFYRMMVLWAACQYAQEHHELRPYDGPLTVLTAGFFAEQVSRYWAELLPAADIRTTPDNVMTRMLQDPVVLEAYSRALEQ